MIYPTKYNLVIVQGATFNPTFTWNNSGGTVIDLSTYTAAELQIRSSINAADPPSVDLTLGSGITLSTSAPNISIFIDDTETSNLTIQQGVYNLNLTDATGNVIRLLEGNVKINPTVIRA